MVITSINILQQFLNLGMVNNSKACEPEWEKQLQLYFH